MNPGSMQGATTELNGNEKDGMKARRVSSELSPDTTAVERAADAALRPRRFSDFVGQRRVTENLGIYVEAARRRGEALDHILLSGLPGLGKTTLAHIVGQELGARLVASSGPVLEKPGDLAGLLTKLRQGDVLFIDEIHRLHKVVEEFLYSAMEDFEIDIMLDQGPSARSLKLRLKRFTLIGATTREGLLSPPFRARFGVRERLDPYPASDLEKIVARSAGLLGVPIDDKARALIAASSRGTPRITNRFLRRLRDVAEVRGDGVITAEVARRGLAMLGVDDRGLEELDRQILKTLAQHNGGPLGLKTLAVSVGEEEQTIEEVYEPYLIQKGLLLKTARGRMLSAEGYKVLGLEARGADPQPGLFEEPR